MRMMSEMGRSPLSGQVFRRISSEFLVKNTRSNRMHALPSSLWICVRSRDVVRRFLRLGTARDGALYTTIGQPLKGAKVSAER
jgi:hypothetical protein